MDIRKARMEDVPAAYRLISGYAESGLMLRRSLAFLYENLRDFVVAVEDGDLVGIGGLHVMWRDLAEIRSLAVSPAHTGGGIGKQLVAFILEEAQTLGIGRVFALTYQRLFFERCGFRVVAKETLPQKVWTDCIACERFESCDEIAMDLWLAESSPQLEEIPLVERPNWVRG